MLISAAAKIKAYQEMIDKEKALADAKKFLEGLNYPVASASDLKSAEKAMIAARDAYEIAQADFEGVKLRAETDPERYQKKDALQKAIFHLMKEAMRPIGDSFVSVGTPGANDTNRRSH